jgi:Putative phage metallopeptidase
MEIGELEEARVCIAPQPLVYRWGGRDGPLPVRVVQPRQPGTAGSHRLASPPWHASGEAGQPFDFTGNIQRLCADMVSRSEELRHIDVSRLLFCVTQARNGRVFGLQARVTPLRFPRGQLTRQRRGVTYQVQRYFLGATEFLYLVTFCLPRFLDQDFDDKFITLFHELHHINPAFDGDLHRHDGRYCVHTHSQKQYDQRMALLAREYLACRPDPALHAFLRLNFNQLVQRHGSVTGIVVPRPKMVPVMLAAASRQK